jgi:hypothetical protein
MVTPYNSFLEVADREPVAPMCGLLCNDDWLLGTQSTNCDLVGRKTMYVEGSTCCQDDIALVSTCATKSFDFEKNGVLYGAAYASKITSGAVEVQWVANTTILTAGYVKLIVAKLQADGLCGVANGVFVKASGEISSKAPGVAPVYFAFGSEEEELLISITDAPMATWSVEFITTLTGYGDRYSFYSLQPIDYSGNTTAANGTVKCATMCLAKDTTCNIVSVHLVNVTSNVIFLSGMTANMAGWRAKLGGWFGRMKGAVGRLFSSVYLKYGVLVVSLLLGAVAIVPLFRVCSFGCSMFRFKKTAENFGTRAPLWMPKDHGNVPTKKLRRH